MFKSHWRLDDNFIPMGTILTSEKERNRLGNACLPIPRLCKWRLLLKVVVTGLKDKWGKRDFKLDD